MPNNILIESNKLVAFAKFEPECNICHGSGFILTSDKQLRTHATKCSCYETRRQITLYNQAQIPSQYWNSDLTNFDIQGLPKVALAINKSKQYLASYEPHKFNKGLLFYGKPGTGKTRLACALIKDFIFKHSISVVFIEFVQLLNNIKHGYDTGEPESEFLSPLVEVDILVIDELGKGRKSEWEASILDQIVSKRYFGQKTTYFTTNFLIMDKFKDDPMSLTNRIDARIYSRLCEMTEFIDMDTIDYRELSTNKSIML